MSSFRTEVFGSQAHKPGAMRSNVQGEVISNQVSWRNKLSVMSTGRVASYVTMQTCKRMSEK